MEHRRNKRRGGEPATAAAKSRAPAIPTPVSSQASSLEPRAPAHANQPNSITNQSAAPVVQPSKQAPTPPAEKGENKRSNNRTESPSDKLKREDAGRRRNWGRKEVQKTAEEARVADKVAAATEVKAAAMITPVSDNPTTPDDKGHGTSSISPLQNPSGSGLGPIVSLKQSVIERKVTLLLNKLTLARLETTADQMVEIVNGSEDEKDGRTLIQVTRLVFEMATKDASSSQICASLCRAMMEKISPTVIDDFIRDADGQPVAGGHLFRKYLLNRCQGDFERGWKVHSKAVVVAATNAVEVDNGPRAEESYDYAKARRQGLGLVRFMGELFKVQMLTERIMHDCVKKFLSNLDNPGEEEIGSVCALLETVGQSLDTAKARSHMDVYFRRLKDLSVDEKVDSSLRTKILLVIELRSRNWGRHDSAPAPITPLPTPEHTTRDEVKEQGERVEMSIVASSSSLDSDKNRNNLNLPPNADEWWSTSKAVDLSLFGDASNVVRLRTSPVLASKKVDDIGQASSPSHATTSNSPAKNSGADSRTSGPHPTSPSAGFSRAERGTGGRRRQPKPPRNNHIEEARANRTQRTSKTSEQDTSYRDNAPQKKVMSDAEVEKQVTDLTDQLFLRRKRDEAAQYFDSLPADKRFKLVESVFARALDSRDAEAMLAGEFFAMAIDAGKLTSEDVEKGVTGQMSSLDDIAVEVPAAYALAAKVLFLAKLDTTVVTRLGDKIVQSMVTPRDKLLKQFENLSL